ncbi:MAG: transporter substrate-binding domain-containing protein [Acidobacteriota bacterium]|nr:transporter substrate-binding domain-containing protein [Acidobacteriota bacterium]
MRTTRIAVVCLALLVIVAATPVFSGEVLNKIVERGEIRVGMTGTQPPLNVKSKTGELIGFEVDLVGVLAASMGVKPKLVVKPFAELLPALQSGEIDMIISGMTATIERNTKVAFVGPYIITGKSILTKSSTLARADEASDVNMETVRLAALEGSTSQEFVEDLMPKAKLTPTQDYASAVKMLLEDNVDAVVADMEICQISMLRHPNAELAISEPLTIEPIGVALPPNDQLLLNLVENYLGALDALGLLEELNKKWFEDGSWLLQLP